MPVEKKGDPPPMLNLVQPWILQMYHRLALSPSGVFAGSSQFKKRLISEPTKPQGVDAGLIRRAVNYMIR